MRTSIYRPIRKAPESSQTTLPKRFTVGTHAAPDKSQSKSPKLTSSRQPNTATTRPRPITRSATDVQSAPNLARLVRQDREHALRHQPSSLAFDLPSHAAYPTDHMMGAVASSFATQMAIATGAVRPATGNPVEDSQVLNRLLLARMKTLEEGFHDVLYEVKRLRRDDSDRTPRAHTTRYHGGDDDPEDLGGDDGS
ncbi:MAG: hypothetical protein M1826_002209 [Phylliscum demangeonii]|nr:MAG: hypothetical protein M1826_002209 [Phylliscum demangeonii]